jgi:hypothetical protein
MTKLDVAMNQLRTSIQLYKKGNYISSITLAGAAEEILGKMAAKTANRNALLDEKLFLDQVAEMFNQQKPILKKVIESRYRAKNELKHNDLGKDSVVRNVDFKFQAEELIIGAINNYMIIFHKEPGDRVIKSFWNWISL